MLAERNQLQSIVDRSWLEEHANSDYYAHHYVLAIRLYQCTVNHITKEVFFLGKLNTEVKESTLVGANFRAEFLTCLTYWGGAYQLL
jgi:hypothetical protein